MAGYRERYGRIGESKWFNKHYDNKSLGETMEIEEAKNNMPMSLKNDMLDSAVENRPGSSTTSQRKRNRFIQGEEWAFEAYHNKVKEFLEELYSNNAIMEYSTCHDMTKEDLLDYFDRAMNYDEEEGEEQYRCAVGFGDYPTVTVGKTGSDFSIGFEMDGHNISDFKINSGQARTLCSILKTFTEPGVDEDTIERYRESLKYILTENAESLVEKIMPMLKAISNEK